MLLSSLVSQTDTTNTQQETSLYMLFLDPLLNALQKEKKTSLTTLR